MKKISLPEIGALIIIQTVTLFSGININILKESTGINSWLTIIITYLIGLIPLLLIIYISSFKTNLNLFEKINNLAGKKIGVFINLLITLTLLVLGITILYNINNFILSQFLYRTPFLLSSTLLIALTLYTVNKGINTISKTSLVLLSFNLVLFLINILALIEHIDINNFFPMLVEKKQNIFPTALKLTSINILPLLLILIIPKDKITKPQNYNKTIIISYLIGSILSLMLTVVIIGVLGIELIKIFQYPGYIVLRKITLFGFLERIENIISLQWIMGTFVYLTIIIYAISKCYIKKEKNNKIFNLIISIILILTTSYIFKNNTIYDYYIKNIFPYIISLNIIIYLIVPILIMKKKFKINRQ